MKKCDSSTFLQHQCPDNKAKQRFHDQKMRQIYVFAPLMSGKQSKTMISQSKNATDLRFCNTDVRKTKQNNNFTIKKIRQFNVFAMLMSRKQSKTMISRPKCATVQRFCNTDVRKTKQNIDFTTKLRDSSTFLRHRCPESKAKQWFHDLKMRQFNVFAPVMSGKQNKTTISRSKNATIQRFCTTDVQKTKQNNDFTIKKCDRSTFLHHWCPENKAKH